MAETKAYIQAARTGMYEKPKGLLGKYDNVRRFWEDQVTARFLAPAFSDLAADKTSRRRRIRVLDLGCGSGDGFELMTRVPQAGTALSSVSVPALPLEFIAEYLGLDINEELIRQAEACHGGRSNIRFTQGDLSDGLPAGVKRLDPFDIYFAGYGTLSHFRDDQAVRIIADIAEHSPDRALFVGDWLGRYSYEWQDLWRNPVDQECFMDYRISYIYPEEERDAARISSFPLRLMTRDEILRVVAAAASASHAEIVPLALFDRSVFVGRHTDTGDYNRNCPKLRSAVNSLFERGRRTDLDSLIVQYSPAAGFDELNGFFGNFFGACNSLVDYTKTLLPSIDSGDFAEPLSPSSLFNGSPALAQAQNTMRRLVEDLGSISWCDVRANFIEPMLGYCLRHIEMDLQPGAGMGHGLIGVFEIRK